MESIGLPDIRDIETYFEKADECAYIYVALYAFMYTMATENIVNLMC